MFPVARLLNGFTSSQVLIFNTVISLDDDFNMLDCWRVCHEQLFLSFSVLDSDCCGNAAKLMVLAGAKIRTSRVVKGEVNMVRGYMDVCILDGLLVEATRELQIANIGWAWLGMIGIPSNYCTSNCEKTQVDAQ